MQTLTSVEHSFDDRWSSSSIGSTNSPGCYKQAITNSWWLTANSVSKFQRIHQRIHNFLPHNFSARGYIQQKSFTKILKKNDQFEPLLERETHTHTWHSATPLCFSSQIIPNSGCNTISPIVELRWFDLGAVPLLFFFFFFLMPRNEHKTITNGHDCNDAHNSTLFISTIENKESLFAIGNLKGGGRTRVPGKSFEIEKQTLQCALNPPKCIHR